MKSALLFITIVSFSYSCNNNHDSPKEAPELDGLQWNNKYEVFDEPNSQAISRMKFYLLMVSYKFMDTLTILSIRQDSTSFLGFLKRVEFMQIPVLFPNQEETKSFKYTTIRFLPRVEQIDSIKTIVQKTRLFSLKDTIDNITLDGEAKEIIVFDQGKIHDIYRTYGRDSDLELNFSNSFNRIMTIGRPNDPR